MGSRNTFVTKYIYWPNAIEIVHRKLLAVERIFGIKTTVKFFGRKDKSAGCFFGVFHTTGQPPHIVEDLVESINEMLLEIGYPLRFDIAVVCDDEDYILHRESPEGTCSMQVPPTEDHPTMWKCANGHVFAASYNMVANGCECPTCEADKAVAG